MGAAAGGLGARSWAEEWKATSKPLRSSRGRLLEKREPLKAAVSVGEVELKHPQRPREEAPPEGVQERRASSPG